MFYLSHNQETMVKLEEVLAIRKDVISGTPAIVFCFKGWEHFDIGFSTAKERDDEFDRIAAYYADNLPKGKLLKELKNKTCKSA